MKKETGIYLVRKLNYTATLTEPLRLLVLAGLTTGFVQGQQWCTHQNLVNSKTQESLLAIYSNFNKRFTLL